LIRGRGKDNLFRGAKPLQATPSFFHLPLPKITPSSI